MNPGDVCFVNYGEVPVVVHCRLLGAQIDNTIWAIITPDEDVYDEDMSAGNPDLTEFTYGGPGLGGAIPAGINPATVYGFRAMTAIRYQQLMQQARVYAAGARAALGLPPVPPVGAPAAVPPPPAALQPMAAEPEVWISIEDLPPHTIGEVIVGVGLNLPPGHVTMGSDKALVPINGGAQGLAIKKIKQSDLSSFSAKDLRVLPMRFDPQGERRRDFAEAVSCMTQDVVPGGGLQLDGPSTALDVLKSFSKRGLTPVTDYERWIRSNEISKSDRSLHDMEVLARVIEALTMTDQLNLPNLKGGEMLFRRWQLIKEAHKISAMAPDYSSASHFMGWELEDGVHQGLSKHVSDQLKDQAAIAKEARKAREEMEHRRRGGRGRGNKGGRGKPSAEDS